MNLGTYCHQHVGGSTGPPAEELLRFSTHLDGLELILNDLAAKRSQVIPGKAYKCQLTFGLDTEHVGSPGCHELLEGPEDVLDFCQVGDLLLDFAIAKAHW